MVVKARYGKSNCVSLFCLTRGFQLLGHCITMTADRSLAE